MPTRPQFELPSYKELEPAVAERLKRIYARPVVLDVQHLGKTFATRAGEIDALADVSFQVHRREFVTVIGPSGCGKSTLIRILAGLENPTTGHVQLDGKEACGPGADRGMVFQAYTLFPWLTVKRNVMFGLLNKGRGHTLAENEAMQWIRMVGLEKFAECYPHQLSGGMKQRVAIARALANQPRILLMDEPFGALDAQTRMKMQSCLQQIWQNVNVTIVFITHDLDEAILLADRIIVLAAHPGRIAEVIEVPLIRPRSAEQMVEPAFLATRARLNELIHPPGEQSEEDRIPVFRMTLVGDDVL
ncbi:MAG TPA: ABC transporter ATP-binding protein [Tepidisphaeraceae bacterium]|jgi:NitT/TauT family transport system ATP-binding protein|nr:ABC transporter ATP-binding protein [Tepidisphaeraceae bacterium]HEV8603941.1 ABC transporter ATP-binding protein [Tepidisphaeraceae bacterium]